MNVNAERKRLIEDYRARHYAETLGCSDREVEGLVFDLPSASTEALVFQLHQRGYTVALEVG